MSAIRPRLAVQAELHPTAAAKREVEPASLPLKVVAHERESSYVAASARQRLDVAVLSAIAHVNAAIRPLSSLVLGLESAARVAVATGHAIEAAVAAATHARESPTCRLS